MRIYLLACVVACAPGANASAENFPYIAEVENDEAYVHSGPGLEFYPTDSLKQGRLVEVYGVDASGWLRIRPPRGSFCWVRESNLSFSDNPAIAQVLADDVAWVGAMVGRVRQHKWQVRLKRGEFVEIVGDKRRLASMGDAAEAWYKIAPPAGEFRWIHQRHVRRKRTDLARSGTSSAVAAEKSKPQDLQLAGLNVQLSDHQVEVQEPESESTKPQASPDGFVPRKKDAAAAAQTDQPPQRLPSAGVAGVMSATPSQKFDDKLRLLDLELSLMVSQSTAFWRLDELRRQTDALVAGGTSALERGRARLLLDKIAKFEAIKTGISDDVAASNTNLLYKPATQNTPGDSTGDVASSSSVLAGATAPGINQRYDGVGWLLPVHAQQRVAPRFALTDDKGRVLQYVVPAPGRNLNRHLRKQVGILGQHHVTPGLGAPVLTARNVVELDRHR